ncbi:hypothetical protein P170DRAFT_441460 [Aspergillus steynii IBT 23096]|uniref:Zinc knuckle-domain-containing protein n=1 Tax=Aspergillus steynii IBT 23096 TaxID=1392250 RepID=A0A2I2FTP5_9EURO|nr:uncharacterized protein P170DRAFT_441460 [Aspergillus steynii IBT 23096]PLB44013.1 hypothetical protein P170DRAFT_441460 [Aspergillus steynii IBT 23096]
MNRYRNAPGARGPSKATPSTLCQKCLKRGHYSYECSVTAQDRPYTSRPSRTQQLLNPKLRPQLSTEVPNDLLRTKGVADDILAKREEDRGRKRDLDEFDPLDAPGQSSKRARSVSSHSTNSVSTISTSRSRSESPPRRSGYTARSGRDRTRSVSSHSRPRKRRYSDSSGYTGSSPSREGARSRSRDWPDDRNTRRRHRESSPVHRGRAVNVSRDGERRERSRSRSVDQSRIARSRRSITPAELDNDHRTSKGYPRDHQDRREGTRGRFSQAHDKRSGRDQGQAPRERSLSPYSKRLALTQAMNIS